jgi:AcrR family transcriptional regulator
MSPRNKQQNEAIRAQSTKVILDAAFKLIAKNGYESTSISQIAREATISKGLVYNYFDSKEDILKTLVNMAFDEGDNIMGEMTRQDEAEKTLRNLFIWFFNELRTRSEFWKLITELSFKIEKFQFVQEIVKKKMEEYVMVLSDLLSRTGIENPASEARMLTAVFDGMGFHYLIMKEAYPLDEMENYLINKYCNTSKVETDEKQIT